MESKKKSEAFFLCVFRVNAACQRGDLLPPWRKDNLLPNTKTPMSDKDSVICPCFFVPLITLLFLWETTQETDDQKRKQSHVSDKMWFTLWGCCFLSISVMSLEKWQRPKSLHRSFWLPSAKETISLPSIIKQTSPVEKCQQKGNIKATFISTQRHRAGRKQLKWAYYVHPMLMKQTKAKGV